MYTLPWPVRVPVCEHVAETRQFLPYRAAAQDVLVFSLTERFVEHFPPHHKLPDNVGLYVRYDGVVTVERG